MRNVVVALGIGAMMCAVSNAGAEAALDWMTKAYGDGAHNAFTDLVRWRGEYYLCFRHGTAHGSMDGEIRVMRSQDLKTWTPCATLDTWGDDRDPHFAATDERLYVYFGTWDLVHSAGHGTPGRGAVRSHFGSTTDGADWPEVRGVYEPGWWLWRVRVHDGAFYSAAYTAVRPRPSARETRLLRSEDGLEWTLVSTVTKERMAGEADMVFDEDDSVWLISRTGDKAGDAAWFHADAPWAEWQTRAMGVLVQSPTIAQWQGRFFVSGRGRQDGKSVTKIWELNSGNIEEAITLPSGGDTGYRGLLADTAADTPSLFVSWYSQHERGKDPKDTPDAASIYVGRVTLR